MISFDERTPNNVIVELVNGYQMFYQNYRGNTSVLRPFPFKVGGFIMNVLKMDSRILYGLTKTPIILTT